MTSRLLPEFLTSKYMSLTRIAKLANLSAWIVFIVNVLLVGGRFVEIQNSYVYQNMFLGDRPGFYEMLLQRPFYAFSLFIDLLSIFLRGAVFGLLLKGLSLGLNMIVQIDTNYLGKQGASDE